MLVKAHEEASSPHTEKYLFKRVRKYLWTLRKGLRKQVKGNAIFAQVKKQMYRVSLRESCLVSVDFEAYERNQSKITEIGISIYEPQNQKLALVPNIYTYHLIIDENKCLKNGSYVPDHMHNFSGGTSYVISLDEARLLLQDFFSKYFGPNSGKKSSLVGHDLRGDLKWLELLGIKNLHNARKLDTQKLFSVTHGLEGASLENALRTVNQPFAFLHNAGNDAYYTLLLAMKLCDPDSRADNSIDTVPLGGKRQIRIIKAERNESQLVACDHGRIFSKHLAETNKRG